ncbi:peptide-methionine (S)-S-oxide reductase MsrA [Lysobacter soyae]|jgi:peptide-methionine (S)-S-oxide reductase|uniref:Peptide methionine sulfoxide reductase MsrA n=1 Tax=Lysobacter soyae TaxID=2764185 RepID=A0ABX8WRQ3_9GAMM|nr:peptide-methionine (S)-S-oxide reductase MsrA [Lysobacter sp. CJ11]QYR53507.1 peptide-methionine (S)-S-oxide reductase MsrA [Lysobacter sp. CJ11]
MSGIGAYKQRMVGPEQALPGRSSEMPLTDRHHVHGRPLKTAAGEGLEVAQFGMGCFWGVERLFWTLPGVLTTAVGYAGGYTPNPTYEEVCTGETGHLEVVRVVFDPKVISYAELLKAFWESHDPTQGMRQGNDLGTQYRSAIHATTEAQFEAAKASAKAFEAALAEKGLSAPISTEIVFPAPEFYYAEDMHQQYLSKNPNGYCGLKGTGVSCPISY